MSLVLADSSLNRPELTLLDTNPKMTVYFNHATERKGARPPTCRRLTRAEGCLIPDWEYAIAAPAKGWPGISQCRVSCESRMGQSRGVCERSARDEHYSRSRARRADVEEQSFD